MVDFTQAEHDFAQALLDDEERKVGSLNRAIAIASERLADLALEESIYEKAKQEALDRLDLLLQAKAAELDITDAVNAPHTVKYLPAHPQNGGGDPTAWEVIHQEDDGGEPPVVSDVADYSHTVNFDNDPGILDAESDIFLWVNWLTSPVYGTAKRVGALNSAIALTQTEIAAIQARNAELEELL